ncbi:DNA helicase [Mycobacterium phage Baka]|uniref:Helix-turn-helix DNA binding protein n=1 Tax=Mycobacterium phage Baka TaxID=2902882 RepID=G1D0A7_9CAUD|nr:DNA helicase [Mycobacterium phage Baka]AEK08205.1 helix-turn-helix DNA binding protein [Mycobacterium phage Baka]
MRDLSLIGEGGRNSALNNAALKLGRLPIDREDLRKLLIDACYSNGLVDDDGLNSVEATIESAFSKADRDGPRMIPERPASLVPAAVEAPVVVMPDPETLRGVDSQFRSRFLSVSDIQNMPKPEPLIEGVFNRGSTALLYGRWGTSKSFIALDWACSLATGRNWQGRETEKVKVLYVVAEGVAGFSSRINAWETAWRQTLEEGSITFLPVPVNLMSQDVGALVEDIKDYGFEFIVLDTIARCTVGAEENSARDVGIVIDSMTRLMDATPDHRGCVLGIHHTGKDEKTLRGSSAYEGGVDTVYFVERGNGITLTCKKQKDAPEGDRHTLRLQPIDGTDSCVIHSFAGPDVEEDAEALDKLRRIMSQMFPNGVSNSELRTVALEQGMTQSSLARARAELMRQGWLINTGNGSRQFWEIKHVNGMF